MAKVNLTNTEVKNVKDRLDDIIQNISGNMEVLGKGGELSFTFLEPIMNKAVEIADRLYLQTKDTINEIEI